MDWNRFRNKDKEINLVGAFEARYGVIRESQIKYLEAIQNLHPITSRQVAAKCLVDACQIITRIAG